MCFGCVSGKYTGLTIVISANENYQNLNEDSIRELNEDIVCKTSSIHNIPFSYLFDDSKFSLLEKFVNSHRLIFITDEHLQIDKNGLFIKPELFPNKLALFQNLEELIFFSSADKCAAVNNINYVFTYENKTLIFDSDSKIEKYLNISDKVNHINIIPACLYLSNSIVDVITDYSFLPPHIEYLHFNNKYFVRNYLQKNLPSNLKILKSYAMDKFPQVIYNRILTECKIPFNCEIILGQCY